MLPGSRAFLYTVGGFDFDLDSQIFVQFVETAERRMLFQRGTDVHYLPTGHLVYIRRSVLFAAPFDIDRLEVLGTPVPVAEGVLHDADGRWEPHSSAFRTTALSLPSAAALQQRRLVWMDRKGKVDPLPLPEATYDDIDLSPNGRELAMMIRDQGGMDIWVYDLDRESLTKLTFSGDNFSPVWSPDGNRVVFGLARSTDRQPYGILSVLADGHAEPEPLTSAELLLVPRSYSPDGLILAFHQVSSTSDIYVLRAGEPSPEPFLATPFDEGGPRFSPDGRWIAYHSNESGRGEIYVRSFPEGSGRQQVSTNGGDYAAWNPEGGELFYKEGNRIMVVDVETGAAFRAGKPRVLFEGRFAPVRGASCQSVRGVCRRGAIPSHGGERERIGIESNRRRGQLVRGIEAESSPRLVGSQNGPGSETRSP